jgi:hypothetical protein
MLKGELNCIVAALIIVAQQWVMLCGIRNRITFAGKIHGRH